MRGVRLHVLIGLAALSMAAAACGSDANDASSGGGETSGSGATESTGASGASTGGGNLYGGGGGGQYGGGSEMSGATGSMGSAGGGGNADVSASVNNYLFQPKTVKVNSGDTLEVRNGNARTPHTFTVVGEDVDLELAPLMSDTTTIDLPPGTYQLICRFHEQLGMKGTLKVS
jgi:plastocyanin